MKQRLSIHTYLILFLFFILIPLLILSIYQGNRFADQKRTYYLHQSKLRNEALKYFVQQIISNDVKLVELVNIAMGDGMKKLTLGERQYLLDRLNQGAAVFHGVYVADEAGTSELFSPQFNYKGERNAPKNYSDRDYFKELKQLKQPVISKLQKGKSSNAPAIQIAIPAQNEYQELIGLTTANVHIDILEKKAKEMISDDPRFRIVLTDHIQQVIFDSMHQSATYKKVDQTPLFKALSHQGNEEEQVMSYFEKDEKNNEMLVYASAVSIRNRTWMLYVIFPKLMIEEEALEARNITFLYSIVIVLTVIFASYLIALRISKGIAKLLSFVQEIGKGSAEQAKIEDFSYLAAHEGQMMIEALRDTVSKLKESALAQKKAEDTVRVNDKLATIGTMVAGIAHEINNPLSYLRGNLDFSIDLADDILDAKNKKLLSQLSTPVPQLPIKTEIDLIDDDLQKIYDIKDALEEALVGVERVSEIVKSLLSISRKDQSKMHELSIKAVIDACIKVANSEIKKKAILSLDIPALPLIIGNESQLGQVILNLLMNATQAIPEGKVQENKITIKAEVKHIDTQDKLLVSISDTGSGIKPELLSKIFDPFFTTKPVGKGTGLGLSICYNIIQNHQGEILVHSELGIGTTFTLVLPVLNTLVTESQVIQTEAAKKALPKLQTPINFKAPSHYRILIVDDMIEVAKGIQRQLSSHGEYECVIVESPLQALQILKEHHFDCMISDLMMPELNGDLFYLRIKEEVPDMASKIFFVSGGIINDQLTQFFQTHHLALVPKPVKLNELLEHIKEIQKRNQRPS